jgi:hypothetical protein
MKHLIYGRFEDRTAILQRKRLRLLFAQSVHNPDRFRTITAINYRLFIGGNREAVRYYLQKVNMIKW